MPRSYVRPLEVVVPFALVLIALLAGWQTTNGFLSPNHVSSLGQTAGYLGIIAIGETIVVLLGGIDLSLPYTINLAAILIAGFQADGKSSTANILLVLLVGASIGLVNGVAVAFLDISPLVMTLGMNSILQGVCLIYSSGSPIGQAPPVVTTISTGWWHQIPFDDLLWLGLTIAVTLVLVFTTFGRGIYGIGANRRASALSGLPVRRTVATGYVLSALAATVGGMLLVGYSGQAYLGQGDEYLLPAIAVVVIGGTSIFGGKGSYVQTVAGVLLITVITSILVTVNVDQAGRNILYGSIILAMAYVNQVALGDRGRVGPSSLRLAAFRGWLQPARRRPDADLNHSDPTEGS